MDKEIRMSSLSKNTMEIEYGDLHEERKGFKS